MRYDAPTSAHSGAVRTAETAAVTSPPDDMVVKVAAERALDPAERRRFRALWREAHDLNHNGVRTSVRLALLEMRREVVERIERAERIARG